MARDFHLAPSILKKFEREDHIQIIFTRQTPDMQRPGDTMFMGIMRMSSKDDPNRQGKAIDMIFVDIETIRANKYRFGRPVRLDDEDKGECARLGMSEAMYMLRMPTCFEVEGNPPAQLFLTTSNAQTLESQLEKFKARLPPFDGELRPVEDAPRKGTVAPLMLTPPPKTPVRSA